MVDIIDAAGYFVYLSYGKRNHSLTPLKLQKLLYLSQGWSYVWDDKPAFAEDFEAWKYGPVNEEVYIKFKKYGRNEIDETESIPELSDKDVEETLDAVWCEYGGKSAYELVDLTHNQRPWKDAYKVGTKITKHSIEQYFQSTY